MKYLINTGTGLVAHATKENADANMIKLVMAVPGKDAGTLIEQKGPPDEGRWPFTLSRADKKVEILMPGCPFEDLVHVRMYVDGNSWVWERAVSIVAAELGE